MADVRPPGRPQRPRRWRRARVLAACLLASAAVGDAVVVAADGAAAQVADAASQLIDLQTLVDAAPAGAVVQLEAGRYTGARIDKALTLRGRGAATVLDAGGRGHVLALYAADIAVQSLRIRGSGADMDHKDSGIWVDRSAPGARIDSVHIDAIGFGIWVDVAPRPVITNCRVIGREGTVRVSDLGNGIHLFNVIGGVVRGNVIEGGRDGVYISNSTGCRIEANQIRRTRFAVHYMYSHANQVVDNVVDSASVGIALMYSKNIQVLGNRVRSGHTHGILLRNLYHSRIEGNETRLSEDGLFFSGCSYDTLTANLVVGNRLGIEVSDSPDNLVAGNAFVDNDEQLSYQDPHTMVWDSDAGGNYWSDYLGWDRDGDGVGDKGHFPADIASYLVRRYPAVRLLMHSPAMVLLQALESRFPVLRPPGVWDLHPLMANPLTEEDRS